MTDRGYKGKDPALLAFITSRFEKEKLIPRLRYHRRLFGIFIKPYKLCSYAWKSKHSDVCAMVSGCSKKCKLIQMRLALVLCC